jgi:predicted RND superfamily exporter protein
MLYWSAALFGDLRANLKELLPENARSVVTFHELEKRFGGWSTLSVIISSPDRAANRRFSDALTEHVARIEGVRSVRNKLGPEKAFFEKRKGLFLELDDLQEIKERIEDAANDARARANPLLVDLENKEPVTLDLSDIEAKYADQTKIASRFPEDYFENKDGTELAMIVRQHSGGFTIAENKRLLGAVEHEVAALDPKKFNPQMIVGLGGDVRNIVDEQATLVEDLITATIICFVLLALVVLLYYRRWRAILLLAYPVLFGTAFTFTLGHFIVGYLNASTAFLGPIIPGNGINFGVILLARYMEERRQGGTIEQSIEVGMRDTLRGTSLAALAASISYGSLMATDFLGFKHFGIIGGIGMLLCWLSTFTVLPAFIVWTERRWPMESTRDLRIYPPGALAGIPARIISRHTRLFAWGGLFTVIAAAIVTKSFLPNAYEKDFNKLRSTVTAKEGSAYWDKKVDAIFGRYLTPQVIVAEKESDVPLIVKSLEEGIKAGGERSPLTGVMALWKLVPDRQTEKLAMLAQIRHLLSEELLSNLEPEQRKAAIANRPAEDLAPFTARELPESIRADFRELDGREGLVVLAEPNISLNLYDADEIQRVAGAVRAIPMPDGRVVESSGNFVIYADMVAAVARDGPRATLYSFLGVLLLGMIAFRRISRVVFVTGSLVGGVSWLLALMYALSIKINFLNFIGLPITFGIGVDYPVNIFSRFLIERARADRIEAARRAMTSTGGAVTLCSLTTIIGYGSLLIARNGALISFGRVAILGEITTLTVALLILPAWLMSWSKK